MIATTTMPMSTTTVAAIVTTTMLTSTVTPQSLPGALPAAIRIDSTHLLHPHILFNPTV